MFSIVLFSVTLCFTASQNAPLVLRKSFWGSVTISAVVAAIIGTVMLGTSFDRLHAEPTQNG